MILSHTTRALGGILALSLSLLACNQPASPATQTDPDPQASDPYANNQMYPWALPDTGKVQTLKAGSNALLYASLASASNSWGPVEQNMSNGDNAAGDGQPLMIGDQAYPQGFGTHAGSELVFNLAPVSGVACSTFTAKVGVDDEVGSKGSVVFQVYADGVKKYDSGSLTGADAVKLVSVDISGAKQLRLVVTDAGDGISDDHADWADPAVTCAAVTAPTKPPPVTSAPVQHLDYVAINNALKIYDIDNGYKLLSTIPLPGVTSIRGIAASAVTDILYIPYFGDRDSSKYAGQPHFGYLMAIDLKTNQVLWNRKYSPSIDSLSMTPDGQKLYMGAGEEGGGDFWFVLDGKTGDEITRIPVYRNAHNTVVGLSGKKVYMGSVSWNYLTVADTKADTIIRKIGPFFTKTSNSGIRPFTVNAAETLAFVNLDHFSGFEIGDIATGKVIYSVPVQGFPWTDPAYPITQSHGVALSPDEKEAWVSDGDNKYVHVFDISGLPAQAPRQIADIDVSDPNDAGNRPKWINFTRDGKYAQISTGAIIDTTTRKIVHKLDNTRYYLQIDVQNGQPVEAYSRYGLGYAGIPIKP